jgi:hypothetical protein
MYNIIEDNLNKKIDDLDFEKDPYNIVEDIIANLRIFDKLTSRSALVLLGPKLE